MRLAASAFDAAAALLLAILIAAAVTAIPFTAGHSATIDPSLRIPIAYSVDLSPFSSLVALGADALPPSTHQHYRTDSSSTDTHLHHLFRRGISDSISNFFKKIGDGLKNGFKAIGDGIKHGLDTVGKGLQQAGKLINVTFGSGFDKDKIQKQSDKVKSTFDQGFDATNRIVNKSLDQANQDFEAAGKHLVEFGKQFATAVVYYGKKAIDGIVAIAKKVGNWIVDHKAIIAAIVVGFIVSSLVFAGLALVTMNPVLAGAIAGSTGAFVGNEVKQIVRAAEQGKLRAPKDFNDFTHLAGEHLKDDVIPIITGGLGGAASVVVGNAVGPAIAGAVGRSVGLPGKDVVSHGITDVLKSSGPGFAGKSTHFAITTGTKSATNSAVIFGSQNAIGAFT